MDQTAKARLFQQMPRTAGRSHLVDVEFPTEKISAVCKAAEDSGVPIVVNARTDSLSKAAAINDTQLPRVWELWTQEIGTID